MPARPGDDYLKGLRATNREIWMGGERIDDVVEHPMLKAGAEAIAAYYDLQIKKPEVLLYDDPETGEPINVSHMSPHTPEQLRQRAEGLAAIAELSMGVMGRTPDYMNVTFAGFADDKVRWSGDDNTNEEGYENLVAFQKRLRREDLSLTHTIVHPTVNKATDKTFADNPVPLHKVGETSDSIIVRGARLLSTLAPYADEQTVYPGAPLPPDAGPEYAVSFSIPMDAPGMVFLCRDSGMRPDLNPVDAPFSSRFDEQDAFCIFDDVEIPKQNVWIDGNITVYSSVMGMSPWWPNVMQQTTIRALTKLEFAYGLVNRMAEAINDDSERTLELLGEILGYVEMTRSALVAGEAQQTTWENGQITLEARAMHPLRSLLPVWFTRVNDIIKTVGSHNLLQVSSQQQIGDPRIKGLIDEFMPGANEISAEDRSNIFRLAWDFTGSQLGGRNELYERNYLSSSRTNRMNTHRMYSAQAKARGQELVTKILEDARARS
ncbi:MAG: 4-hydroxyphenylacetate 3-hydroxylase N-terminal domain-containing protein [Acidimicrobiales bacterium]